MLVFAQEKMCDYQRSSEHVVTRRGSTGRSTILYRCTIDVRTHTGPYGVPTGPPGPHRDPTGLLPTAGGIVGLRLIGRVGNEHCSVFGERLFSSVFCSVFNSEHVRHFVRLLFVFGVRRLLCSCSGSALLFCLVRCSGRIHMLMLNVSVECQGRMPMSNANVECQ